MRREAFGSSIFRVRRLISTLWMRRANPDCAAPLNEVSRELGQFAPRASIEADLRFTRTRYFRKARLAGSGGGAPYPPREAG